MHYQIRSIINDEVGLIGLNIFINQYLVLFYNVIVVC